MVGCKHQYGDTQLKILSCFPSSPVQVVKMSLFNTFSSKSVRLEEFEQVQFAATDSVANHLRDNWTASIKSIIKYAAVAKHAACDTAAAC